MPTNFLPLYRRELSSYSSSPAVYAAVAIFFFLSGLFFFGVLVSFAEASTNAEYRRQIGLDRVNFTVHVAGQLFASMNFLLVMLTPMITMRLLAEERKTGTFELLTSLPFSDADIVVAKFLAAWTLLMAILGTSLLYVLVMFSIGRPEFPVILVAYLGLALASAVYVAIGLLASSVTENQIVAAILGIAGLLALYLIGDITPASSDGIGRYLEMLSLRAHTEQFTRGLVRLEDILYLVLMTGAFLFLTLRILEVRRWKI
jgi:ABC-2 type transport system permease protein